MQTRHKIRFKRIIDKSALRPSLSGSMHGTAKNVGNIVAPAWGDEPWDAELGIAYQGENGPVYYTGNGTETTDDLP